MINKLIIDTLKELDIPIYYQEARNKTDKYIIFSIYNEEDTKFYDDTNLSETYSITLNYWYMKPGDLLLYKKIKQLLKSNGFTFNGSSDLKDGKFFGKNMDFFYEEIQFER